MEDKQTPSQPTEQTENKFVDKSKFDGVLTDLYKQRDSNKSLQARISELESKIQAQDSAELESQKKYQELFQKEKEKHTDTLNKFKQLENNFVTQQKQTYLASKLQVSKPEYLKFADLSKIEINSDGTIDTNSVDRVVNEFKNSHPELIKRNEQTTDIKTSDIFQSEKIKTRDLKKQDPDDLKDMFKEALKTDQSELAQAFSRAIRTH